MATPLDKIVPYRRGLRPVDPLSLPVYVDWELDRASQSSTEMLEAIKAQSGTSSLLTLDGGDASVSPPPAYTIEGGTA